MNQPIHNAYWLTRFDSILDSALAQHRAISLIRVDLRFPEYMPATIMDTDFRIPESKNSGLPAEKTTSQQACACNHSALFLVSGVWQGKRQETLSRDITAQQRYLVLARGFHRSFFAGDTDQAGMV